MGERKEPTHPPTGKKPDPPPSIPVKIGKYCASLSITLSPAIKWLTDTDNDSDFKIAHSHKRNPTMPNEMYWICQLNSLNELVWLKFSTDAHEAATSHWLESPETFIIKMWKNANNDLQPVDMAAIYPERFESKADFARRVATSY